MTVTSFYAIKGRYFGGATALCCLKITGDEEAMGSGLGMLITEDGEVPLERIVLAAEAGHKGLRSQGFQVTKCNTKPKTEARYNIKPSRVRLLSREEIMLEEIARFARNKTMIIIGFVMIFVESEYFFYDIEEVVLYGLVIQAGFQDISLTDVRRVMTRIDNSDLVEELIVGNRIGLNRAYNLYLGK